MSKKPKSSIVLVETYMACNRCGHMWFAKKQENLVKALWNFAEAQQNFGEERRIITNSRGTCVSDPAMRKAIREIMDNFGYDVLEVQ